MGDIVILKFIKREFENISKFEMVLYVVSVLTIVFVSTYLHDSKIALLSSIFGISYTIFAGRGKIYCYFFGLFSSLLYSYLAFKNGFFGNFILNFFYYFPMQIIGIFMWKKHLKKNSLEIIKTKLNIRNRAIIFSAAAIISLFLGYILKYFGNFPFLDGITFVFSVFAMILTIKRCIEQWYFWIIVNMVSVIMWINAYLNNSNCFVMIIMWCVYLILGLYFLKKWKIEIKDNIA